ncbi:hypothetical protein GCM10023145_10730 [Angustibacter luteus]
MITAGGAGYGGCVGEPRITLVGRDGCHLCDDAREVVRRVAEDTGAGWVELDVDDDPDLLRQYGEMVPVVLVDGSQHDFYRVDERRLRDALQGRRLGVFRPRRG